MTNFEIQDDQTVVRVAVEGDALTVISACGTDAAALLAGITEESSVNDVWDQWTKNGTHLAEEGWPETVVVSKTAGAA